MTLTPDEISAFLAIETHRHPLVAERRELVVRGLVEGKTHSEIAAELNVKPAHGRERCERDEEEAEEQEVTDEIPAVLCVLWAFAAGFCCGNRVGYWDALSDYAKAKRKGRP